jgi:hypothetical protein
LLFVTWKKGFATTTQKLTLIADAKLEVSSHTHFTDRSGRADYDSNETFVKGLVHDWSDTPKDAPRNPTPPTAPPTAPQPGPAAPAKIAVVGAINEKWMAMGGAGGKLRQPVANEKPTFDNVGRSQQFQGGIISWHPDTGAHVVWGLIGEHWLRLGAEKFGYPITDELPTGNRRGLHNHFRALQLPNHPEASIFWSKTTGAHAVFGAIRDRWAQLGWDGGKLGFPTSDEHDAKVDGVNGKRVDFEKGYIAWTPKRGARETVAGVIDNGPVLIPAND